MSSITVNGFERSTREEILIEVQDNYKTKYSDGGANTPSFEPEDYLGAQSEILTDLRYDLEGLAESIYYSIFLSTATGIQLDRAAAPTVRRNAVQAQTNLVFSGDPLASIPALTEFETENGVRYVIDSVVNLDGGGAGSSAALAVVAGISGNAPIDAVRFIPVPVTGLNTVTNDIPATGGLEIENDPDFRVRAILDRSADLTSSLTALTNRILEITNVSAAIGFENTLNVIDGDGRPPGSIEMVVRGGLDADIAQSIFNTKAAGVETTGTELVVINDAAGNPHDIEFSRVTDIEVWAEVTLTTNAGYNPSVSDDVIRQRILDYIGGVNPSTVESPGVGIFENVFAWKCEAVVFELNSPDAIPGIDEISVLIDTVASPINETEIIIDSTEEAFTDFTNIGIIIV